MQANSKLGICGRIGAQMATADRTRSTEIFRTIPRQQIELCKVPRTIDRPIPRKMSIPIKVSKTDTMLLAFNHANMICIHQGMFRSGGMY